MLIFPEPDPFLRAILGYAASPAILTVVVHVTYLVVVLVLYLRPVRRTPSAATPAAVRS